MAGLAQDENPREMAQWHSQEWLCHWGCRPNPQRRGRLIIWGGPAIHNYDAAEDLRRGGATSVGRRLRVVALTGARSNVGFCDLDFQLVIFVSLTSGGRIEGDLIVGLRIGETLSQETRHVIVEVERKATTLYGEYLQRQIRRQNMAGFLDPFEEGFIVSSAQLALGGPERIDAVESNVSPQELGRKVHNIREELLLLLGVDEGHGRRAGE